MYDFVQKNYLLITHSVEFTAGITGMFFYKKFRLTHAKYFIFFLIYLTVCEILGSYTSYVKKDKVFSFLIGTQIEKNYWWYTLFWKIGAVIFFGFYFNKIIKNKNFKRSIKLSTFSFFVFSLIYIFFNWNTFFISFFPIISVLGAIIIFICSVFYFIEILNSDKILTFYKSLNFYISTSIFIWWLIITPLVFYDIYITYEVGNSNEDLSYTNLRRFIYLSANIIMYLTFTFALIFCEPETDNP